MAWKTLSARRINAWRRSQGHPTNLKVRSRRRRSRGKKRAYRKKRSMSTRSILNKTSRKKRNTMLSWSNSDAITGAQAPLTQSPLTIAGGSGSSATLAWVHFTPTAMDLNTDVNAPNFVQYEGMRTSTTCFMRGLNEKIRIETSTGNPWFHRRIAFCSKNPVFYVQQSADASGTERAAISRGALETSSGWIRLAANMLLDTLTATNAAQREVLFKGAQGIDWDDFITAPVDTNRVDLKYDKTFIYKSGNERGIVRETKLWHPMNKNLRYDDDERGQVEDTQPVSVLDKRGMGNMHIIDLFSQGSSGSTSDRLRIRYTSSLYWHEK